MQTKVQKENYTRINKIIFWSEIFVHSNIRTSNQKSRQWKIDWTWRHISVER